MHAETLEGMVNRLLNPPMNIPRELIPTLNFALHISRVRRGGRILRRVLGVWEIVSADSCRQLARWNPATDGFELRLRDSAILDRVAASQGLSKEDALREVERRARLLEYLAVRGAEYDEIVRWVYEYYKDPSNVIARVEEELARIVPVARTARQAPREPPVEGSRRVVMELLRKRLEELEAGRKRRTRRRVEVRVEIPDILRRMRGGA